MADPLDSLLSVGEKLAGAAVDTGALAFRTQILKQALPSAPLPAPPAPPAPPPPPPPAPVIPASSASPSVAAGLPSWVVPVGIGAFVLVVVVVVVVATK